MEKMAILVRSAVGLVASPSNVSSLMPRARPVIILIIIVVSFVVNVYMIFIDAMPHTRVGHPLWKCLSLRQVPLRRHFSRHPDRQKL